MEVKPDYYSTQHVLCLPQLDFLPWRVWIVMQKYTRTSFQSVSPWKHANQSNIDVFWRQIVTVLLIIKQTGDVFWRRVKESLWPFGSYLSTRWLVFLVFNQSLEVQMTKEVVAMLDEQTMLKEAVSTIIRSAPKTFSRHFILIPSKGCMFWVTSVIRAPSKSSIDFSSPQPFYSQPNCFSGWLGIFWCLFQAII